MIDYLGGKAARGSYIYQVNKLLERLDHMLSESRPGFAVEGHLLGQTHEEKLALQKAFDLLLGAHADSVENEFSNPEYARKRLYGTSKQ